MATKASYQGHGRPFYPIELIEIQRASQSIGRCQLQSLDGDLVVVGRERQLPQDQLSMVLRLIDVPGQDTLVEACYGGQRWAIAEYDIKVIKPRDVTANDDEAQRERSG